MAITYTIDAARGIVLERWIGEISGDELAKHWQVMTSDSVAMGCRGSLADISNCEFQVTGEELTQIVRTIVIPAIPTKAWKAAVLVSRPVQFGVARQYGAWVDDLHQMEIFSNREVAIDWLIS